MRPFVILTDSTCDLRMETLQQRQISYVTMGYTVDGTEYPARLDWQAHTPQQQTLFVSHADAQAQAQALAQQITDTVPFKDVYINTIAPIVGASVGPGTIIAFCFGKEVQLEGGN